MLITPKDKPILISLYRAMRRALMALKSTKIVGKFLGTKSYLNDFVFNWKNDASLRAADSNDVPIYPYLLTDTFDACLGKDYVIDPNELAGSDGVFYKSKMLRIFSLHSDRPLWQVYNTCTAAIDVALVKLNSEPGMIDLTSFIIRTGALIIPQSVLSHQLVLSGLATLLHVDPDGINCLTYYFPEPIVSNAARIRMTDDVKFANGLSEFLLQMNAGTFKNTGDAGEVVAKLLLLRGFDRSLLKAVVDVSPNFERHFKFNFNSKMFISPKFGFTTAREFLSSSRGLSDDGELDVLDASSELLGGFISLNQFTQVSEGTAIDELFLRNGFVRSTAFSLYHH